MTIHKVALNWKGKMHFESEGPGGTVAIDGAEEFGGEGKGVRPKAMMLSALAGCAGMDISSLLKKMRAEVAHFSIDVEGELTKEHPKTSAAYQSRLNFTAPILKNQKLRKPLISQLPNIVG